MPGARWQAAEPPMIVKLGRCNAVTTGAPRTMRGGVPIKPTRLARRMSRPRPSRCAVPGRYRREPDAHSPPSSIAGLRAAKSTGAAALSNARSRPSQTTSSTRPQPWQIGGTTVALAGPCSHATSALLPGTPSRSPRSPARSTRSTTRPSGRPARGRGCGADVEVRSSGNGGGLTTHPGGACAGRRRSFFAKARSPDGQAVRRQRDGGCQGIRSPEVPCHRTVLTRTAKDCSGAGERGVEVGMGRERTLATLTTWRTRITSRTGSPCGPRRPSPGR